MGLCPAGRCGVRCRRSAERSDRGARRVRRRVAGGNARHGRNRWRSHAADRCRSARVRPGFAGGLSDWLPSAATDGWQTPEVIEMKSCLIVDDSRVIRKVSRHILETLGFQVEEAENGQEGLDKCAESMPDVVLLDWNMPVMTGIEFITQLRVREGGDKPKVVFCTTEND